ncbi:hypothetical protein D4764_20G0002510 [Takifugu flavidus]|uniref:Uncharacterized protein n=1 Tax=Takifugu flavidus TaxID=433684 RepID=A0A5C6NHX1_9TELE|nr:hypothetical protein D4764_20G0002510 [Takifugu flavidus]
MPPGQQLNRPEVQRWAETVSRGSPVRSDAPRIPDSDDRPRRKRNPIMATTTCTRFTDEYQLYEELGK